MLEGKSIQKILCYHCGDVCETDQTYEKDDKSFCCLGCQTVYEILSENDLCQYYDLEQSPGVNQKAASALFDFLDNEQVAGQLLDFSDDRQGRITFSIPNIHCSSCIWLLEHLEKMSPGIIDAQVNFTQKKYKVHYNKEKTSLRQLAELLDRIGYTPVFNLEGEKGEQKAYQTFDKKLLIKMGIAGFCFGNVMLLSFPDYLGIEGQDEAFIRLFRGLNVLLSLPVVFYAGFDYFTSAFKSLQQRYANIDVPIALGISVLFLRSTYEVIADLGPGYFDSLVGLIFFLLIGKWFQNRTYQALSFDRDYKSYFPLAVLKKVGETFQPVMVKELKKGDELLIRNTELVPTDAILISEKAFIDYSFVTGESEPVEKNKGQYVYAGGRVAGQQASFISQKAVSQSYLTSLWNEGAYQKKTATQRMVDRVSQYFTITIVAIAVLGGFFWQLTDPSKTWLVLTSVLIIACPCALALSTPFTTGSILRLFGKHQFFLKNADVIEALQKITTIVFDKTGTLTETGARHLSFEGQLTGSEKEWVATAISSSTHPLSRYIKSFLKAENRALTLTHFKEIPGKGIEARVEGHEVKLGSASFLFDSIEVNQVNRTEVHLMINGQYKGAFVAKNAYRKGLQEVIDGLKQRFKLAILSGDNASEKEKLHHIFPATTQMLFQQKPDNKLTYVQNLQAEGEKVLMMGDGLNDAGALKQSTVGVSVTEDISAFSPACDAIMAGSAFAKLNALLQLADRGKKIIRWSIIISLVYNVVGISFALAGMLTPLVAAVLMPLSSITVVAFTTMAVNWMGYKLKL